jgi:para-aminobenzoate synthetase/4-amino-4-deoxychorismate lyase
MRLTVAPAASGELRAEAHTAPVEAADVFPSWERAVALRSFAFAGGLGSHKWADREALAQLEARCGERELPLLVDAGEEALEASRANLFAVHEGAVVTPPADDRILAGVARARAIEAARALEIEVREEPLALEQLIAAGEAFLTGSIRGVEPVGSLDGTRLRAPGAEASAIAAHVRQRWLGGDHDAGRIGAPAPAPGAFAQPHYVEAEPR